MMYSWYSIFHGWCIVTTHIDPDLSLGPLLPSPYSYLFQPHSMVPILWKFPSKPWFQSQAESGEGGYEATQRAERRAKGRGETATGGKGRALAIGIQWMLPSGKHTKSYGKSPFLKGKSTINGPFSIAMLVYQRVWILIMI